MNTTIARFILVICGWMGSTCIAQCVIEPTGYLPGGTIGHVISLSPTRAVYISGKWLATVDTSDPANPTVVSHQRLEHTDGLTAVNDYLYVTRGGYGLSVFDASDPDNLKFVRNTQVFAGRLNASEGLLLGSGNATSPLIVDLKDPSTPQILSGQETSGYYEAIKDGDFLWCIVGIGWQRSVLVWDISDLQNPSLVSEYPFVANGSVPNFFLIGSILYINVRDNVLIIDYTDPSSPTALDPIERPPGVINMADIALREEMLYVTSGEDIYIY